MILFIKEITLTTSIAAKTVSEKTVSATSTDKPVDNAPISANSTMATTDETMTTLNDSTPNDLAKQMQQASQQASQLLKSLSHPDRLLLLCQLTQGEYCVGELETLVGVGQPSLSQQLGILRKDELVATRREGKQIYYSIASEDALAVLQLLYQRFCA